MTETLRVLMAEDEWLAAEVLAEGLSEAGFTVLAAADGLAAFEMAAGGAAFDLLLTDLRMPRMDGRELIARLRADRPNLPVVVMTGFPPPDGADALHAGMPAIRLLTKPIAIGPLVAALWAVAGRGGDCPAGRDGKPG
jgi:CheY-like chemotaxis protein